MAVNLANLSGSSYVSNSALGKVLQNLRENPELLEESGVSRWAVKRKRTSVVSTCSEFGPLIQSMELVKEDGTLFKCWYANPASHLEMALQRSRHLRTVFQRALQENASGWHLVAYSDGVTPGNALKPLNRRKTWVVYWTFCELNHHLQNDLCWFTMLILRSDEVKEARSC